MSATVLEALPPSCIALSWIALNLMELSYARELLGTEGPASKEGLKGF